MFQLEDYLSVTLACPAQGELVEQKQDNHDEMPIGKEEARDTPGSPWPLVVIVSSGQEP